MSLLSSHVPLLLGLAVLTAIGYTAATLGMKLASGGTSWIGLAIIFAGFAAAAIAEITMLQRIDLARTYVIILAVESLLIFLVALWFGEALSAARIVGAALVLIGMMLTIE